MGLRSILPGAYKERIKRQLGVLRTSFALERLRNAGFTPRCVLDLGANQGEWGVQLRSVWPGAALLMVEGNPRMMPELERTAALLGNSAVRQALLAERSGAHVRFFEADTASCIVPEDDPRESANLTTTSLDDLVRDTPYAAPDLIKLDLQGAELRTFAGGEETLSRSEVLVVELNLLPLISGAPLLAEVTCHLASKGFRLYDLGDYLRRPSDKAMWWIDGIFVHQTSPLLRDRPYE